MAHAKLHIICGNCGCNNMFEYHISKDIDDDTNENIEVVYITCGNCNTLHGLYDNAKLKKKNN